MSDGEELQIIDAEVQALSVRRPPEVVLEEAHKAAAALKKVIEAKPKKVMFNGEQYLEVEDWQTIGRFYGITAKIESVNYVEYGVGPSAVRGFNARAVAIRADGAEISAAEGECLNDEEKWGERPKYEWKDVDGTRQRVQIGTDKVPLFQLKSMAQTRAMSKVFRNVLAWVVVLAGYRPTPAEELPTTTESNAPSTTAKQGGQPPTTNGAAATTAGAPMLDGSGVVKEVKPGAGEKKPTRVTMEDGRSGTTFDKTLIKLAQDVQASGTLVVAKFDTVEKGDRKFVNLVGLDIVRTDQPELLPEDKEPVGQPEKILVVRPVAQEGSDVQVIQSEYRQYLTRDPIAVQVANQLREAKAKAIISFTREKTASGKAYNALTKIDEATPEQVTGAPAAPTDAEVASAT